MQHAASPGRMVCFIFSFLWLSTAGCTSVTVDHLVGQPTGEKTSQGVDLADALDGIWVTVPDESVPGDLPDAGADVEGAQEEIEGQADIVYLKYLSPGKVRVAGMFWGDNRFEIEEQEFLLSENQGCFFIQSGEDNLITGPEIEERADQFDSNLAGKYELFFARLDGEFLRIAFPDDGLLREAIDSGELKGEFIEKQVRIEDGDTLTVRELHITANPAELSAYFVKERLDKHFEQPTVFSLKRLSKFALESEMGPPEDDLPAPVTPNEPEIPPPPAPLADPNA